MVTPDQTVIEFIKGTEVVRLRRGDWFVSQRGSLIQMLGGPNSDSMWSRFDTTRIYEAAFENRCWIFLNDLTKLYDHTASASDVVVVGKLSLG